MSTPPFAVDVEIGTRRVRLTGVLTGPTSCLLDATLGELLRAPGGPVTVDARAVTHVDPEGAECLSRLGERARGNGTLLVLLGAGADRGTDVHVPGRRAG